MTMREIGVAPAKSTPNPLQIPSACSQVPYTETLTVSRGKKGNLRGMIPEIDIWRVANLMLKRYGDNSEVESARRADELWEDGDAAGVVVWRRVMGAVRQLANTTPLGPV